MNPLFRLVREVHAVWAMSSPWLAARYTSSLMRQLPTVYRTKTLAPVDASMDGIQRLDCNGQSLILPLDVIADHLRGHDDTPTFGMAREMYGANVYLRAFRPDLRMGTVVDFGANRGMFQLMATCGYGARVAIGVEPNPLYEPVLRALQEFNGLAFERVPRHRALASATRGEGKITLEQLMELHGLQSIDFLKCDIEGGEFDVILRSGRSLGQVSNIAMELHHHAGDAAELERALCSAGLRVVATDQFGRVVGANRACYLYASRNGDLVL